MQCSLYGKLPTKRDFIAAGVPREFLAVWEPWLQGSVSASRVNLGDRWQAAFLTAPIWRFWLGSDLCGVDVIGAFMPSLDGVGRYFPLTLIACADPGFGIAPPESDAQEAWFTAAEALLMSALDHDRTFDAVMADLADLPAPMQIAQDETSGDFIGDGDSRTGEPDFAAIFEALRKGDHGSIYGSATFWWTLGGEGFAPMALCRRRMPDPYLFPSMLTGKHPQYDPVAG
jgi:type VI secretion system protein ImpM